MTCIVVIAGENLPFPAGMAGTERVKALGKVFQHCGCAVEVMVLRPTETTGCVRNSESAGVCDGMQFRYSGGVSVLSTGWFQRRWDEIAGFAGFARRIRALRRSGHIIIVVGYTLNPVFAVPMLLVARLYGGLYVQEVCEWLPATTKERGGGICARVMAYVFCRCVLRWSDGVIAISRFLMYRCLEQGVKPGRVVLVPALFSAPQTFVKPRAKDTRLVFAGSGGYRQIIDFVLDVCVELARRGCDFSCEILLGLSKDADGPSVARSVAVRGLESRVQITGYLSRNDYEKTLAAATALLIPLPEIDSSRARFPNKLIEYLLTARPVVSNGIGEVGLCLSDRVNAMVCDRFDPAEYANAIEWVIDNPILAENCGRRGRHLALERFAPAAHSGTIRSLVDAITND